MRELTKLFIAIIILAALASCNRISEKVEEKVNKKIDETIDKTMERVDSSLNKINLDSLKKQIDKLDTVVSRNDKNKNK